MVCRLVISFIFIIYLSACSFSPKRATISPYLSSPSHIPEGRVYARFFGTSTILISDGKNSILIDGFFTRPRLFQLKRTNHSMVRNYLNKSEISDIDLVLISHSHYDHALDSGYVADLTGATLMGSQRSLSISPADKHEVIDINKTKKVGGFEVSFYETKHGAKPRLANYFESMILKLSDSLIFKDHAEVYSFYIHHKLAKILIFPSASALELTDKRKIDIEADIVFLGIGLLSSQCEDKITEYWNSAVLNTGASLVIPIHWDDFTIPLSDGLVTPRRFVDDLDKTMRTLNRLANDSESKVRIAFPPLNNPFLLDSRKVLFQPSR